MSRLSEERIELLAIKHAPPVHPDFVDCDDWHDFARAIEREALKEVKVQIPTNTMEQEFAWRQRKGFVAGYKQGQAAMRERAASLCDRFQERQMQPAECAGAIRRLEIEEPK